MPRLHILQLHESPIIDGTNYERFDHQWILVAGGGSPRGSDDDAKIFPGVDKGDIIWFKDLQTGAGEFEGVYFVGETETENDYPLHKGGVEGPEFPPAIAEGATSDELRTRYEPLFNKILEHQHLSLSDLFGGEEVVEEFWQSPTIQRAKDPPEEKWDIPLDRCTWSESYDG